MPSQNPPNKVVLWISYVLSALPVLLMVFSAIMKFVQPPMVVEGFAKNGMTSSAVLMIGVVELLCAVLYIIPKTAVLGAILVTGYLGGAIMVHVRAHEMAGATPLLLGVLAWAGLYLRDVRLRQLLPLRERLK